MIKLTDRDEERFWAKVTIPIDMVDECWEYPSLRPDGYGQFTFRKPDNSWDTKMAHRISYELTNGPIPPGMNVCHKCDNPACINPCHFFIGTNADNVRDMDSKGRRVNHPNYGTANGFSKLTPDLVLEIRDACLAGESQDAVALRFGIVQGNVGHIMNGRTWSRVTGIKEA